MQRLMRQEGLVAATTRRRRYGTYRGEISSAPENLINREFHAVAPNQKWLTDITEFQIPAGKVYLLPVIDCFDGVVVSGSIGTRPDAELVNTMLDSATSRWLIVMSGQWSTLIAVRTIVGRDGYPGCTMPGSFARCDAKDARPITQPVKAPSGDSRRKYSILVTGGLRPLINSSSPLTPASGGTTQRGSTSRSALSAPLNTGRVLELRHKSVQEFSRTPNRRYILQRRELERSTCYACLL